MQQLELPMMFPIPTIGVYVWVYQIQQSQLMVMISSMLLTVQV